MLRYWTGWQQVHERLAKKTEVSSTVLSADGSGVPYRRRDVNLRCGRYLVDARSGFRPGCGQPLGAFREQPREQKVVMRGMFSRNPSFNYNSPSDELET